MKKLTAADRRDLARQNRILLRKWLKKNKPLILGLDISTTSSGVYLLNKGTGYLLTPKVYDIRERIAYLERKIVRILEIFCPNICFIEDYSLSLKGSSLMQLAECGGVVRNILYKNNIPIFAVAPQTLKKFVLGQGKGAKAKGPQAKSLMLLETFAKWGLKFDNDDECDAYCLCQFGFELLWYVRGGNFSKWKVEMFDNFLATRGDTWR